MTKRKSQEAPLAETPGAAAQLEHEGELAKDRIMDPDDDHGDLGDPKHPPEDASEEMMETYMESIDKYCTEMLQCLQKLVVKGETLWIEYTCTFSVPTVMAMSTTQQAEWVMFLRGNGVYVKRKRGYSRWKALRDCLTQEEFVPMDATPAGPSLGEKHLDDKTDGGNQDEIKKDKAVVNDVVQPEQQKQDTVLEPTDADTSLKDPTTTAPIADSNRYEGTRREPTFSKRNGVESIMKAYQHRTKFSGSFTEDFQGTIEQFETLATVCDLSKEDMAKSFPVMLTGSAFAHYSRKYSRRSIPYTQLVD